MTSEKRAQKFPTHLQWRVTIQLGSASDWLNQISHARGTTNKKRYTDLNSDASSVYGISALVSQTSFGGETSGGVAECPLFSQANKFALPAEKENLLFVMIKFVMINLPVHPPSAKEVETGPHFKNCFAGPAFVLGSLPLCFTKPSIKQFWVENVLGWVCWQLDRDRKLIDRGAYLFSKDDVVSVLHEEL